MLNKYWKTREGREKVRGLTNRRLNVFVVGDKEPKEKLAAMILKERKAKQTQTGEKWKGFDEYAL